KRGLVSLPPNFAGLDASRPWFVFWISHSLEILDEFSETLWSPQVAAFLSHCQDPTGGFGGGPSQLPHLAPTYAAVSALVLAGSETAYKAVDRSSMYSFLMRMKSPHGGFKMHDEGETDMRGCYCAIAVASMLHLLTDELLEGVPEYIRRCQTWEGGIAGEEGLEAHGGYSYCGLAALCIAGRADALDLHAFLKWAVYKQMTREGGFQGRANKLVDSCYSFWQGAIFPLLHEAFRQRGEEVALPKDHCWFAPQPLQTYILLACQHPNGGLRDKPGKSADFYHTCYALSGMAVSQYDVQGGTAVFGDPRNLLERTDIYYNVAVEKAERKCAYFNSLPPLSVDGRTVQGREGSGAAALLKWRVARNLQWRQVWDPRS
ncbi:FNTB, partial [Symbiodinium sp. CCMP2456]